MLYGGIPEFRLSLAARARYVDNICYACGGRLYALYRRLRVDSRYWRWTKIGAECDDCHVTITDRPS